jgi:hypothetical protein
MLELMDKLNGGELIGLVAIIGWMLIAVIGVVTYQWRRVRVAEVESGLKQSMVEKGMSPTEIEQVINAGRSPRRESHGGSTGNETLDKTALAQQMIDNGYEGEDIERVLRAFQSPAKQVEEHVVAH